MGSLHIKRLWIGLALLVGSAALAFHAYWTSHARLASVDFMVSSESEKSSWIERARHDSHVDIVRFGVDPNTNEVGLQPIPKDSLESMRGERSIHVRRFLTNNAFLGSMRAVTANGYGGLGKHVAGWESRFGTQALGGGISWALSALMAIAGAFLVWAPLRSRT